MRKLSLLKTTGAATVILGVATLVPSFALAGADKVDVCHLTGNGTYRLINVSTKALPAHLNHGDALPGDIIDGKLVRDDCSTVAVNIVNSAPLNFSGGGWGGWSCPDGTTVIACDVGGADVAQKVLWVPGASVMSGQTQYSYPTTPFGYTYTPPETGCIVQNDSDQETITITLTCASE